MCVCVCVCVRVCMCVYVHHLNIYGSWRGYMYVLSVCECTRMCVRVCVSKASALQHFVYFVYQDVLHLCSLGPLTWITSLSWTSSFWSGPTSSSPWNVTCDHCARLAVSHKKHQMVTKG